MAFCPNCGSQANGSFCPNCGTSLGSSAAGPTGFSPSVASGLTPNIVALLCYLLGIIGGIIFLLIEPYSRDRTVRFHAFQSIFLTLAYVIIMIVIGVVGHAAALFIWPLVQIFFLVVWVYLMITAYQGKKIVLPVIGELAQKQA